MRLFGFFILFLIWMKALEAELRTGFRRGVAMR